MVSIQAINSFLFTISFVTRNNKTKKKLTRPSPIIALFQYRHMQQQLEWQLNWIEQEKRSWFNCVARGVFQWCQAFLQPQFLHFHLDYSSKFPLVVFRSIRIDIFFSHYLFGVCDETHIRPETLKCSCSKHDSWRISTALPLSSWNLLRDRHYWSDIHQSVVPPLLRASDEWAEGDVNFVHQNER